MSIENNTIDIPSLIIHLSHVITEHGYDTNETKRFIKYTYLVMEINKTDYLTDISSIIYCINSKDTTITAIKYLAHLSGYKKKILATAEMDNIMLMYKQFHKLSGIQQEMLYGMMFTCNPLCLDKIEIEYYIVDSMLYLEVDDIKVISFFKVFKTFIKENEKDEINVRIGYINPNVINGC